MELFNDTDSPQIKEALLTAMNYELRKKYDMNFLSKNNAGIVFFLEDFSRSVVAGFKGIVYGSRIDTKNTFEIPDGKLANFKLALFPRWLLKKFPPRMRKIEQTITVFNSYPNIPILDKTLRYYINDKY